MSRDQSPVPAAANGSSGAANGENGEVELHEIMTGKPKLPIEDDIMQLARLGEIKAIQKLFDAGKFSAKYTDEQQITPLHVQIIPLRPSPQLTLVVGCHQQSLRPLPLSHTSRR